MPKIIDGSTSSDLLPKGYFFMFSTLDYFSQRLTFQNIGLLTPLGLGAMFYPSLQEPRFHERKCSEQLLAQAEQVLALAETCPEVVGKLVEEWVRETETWKQVGLSSVFYDRMMNFVKKKSILIDDSVFLISTSGSDSESGRECAE